MHIKYKIMFKHNKCYKSSGIIYNNGLCFNKENGHIYEKYSNIFIRIKDENCIGTLIKDVKYLFFLRKKVI